MVVVFVMPLGVVKAAPGEMLLAAAAAAISMPPADVTPPTASEPSPVRVLMALMLSHTPPRMHNMIPAAAEEPPVYENVIKDGTFVPTCNVATRSDGATP
jgi:hypothetical protein